MGWLAEFRSSLENPATPLSFPAEWLLDIFTGGRTDSGIRVSEVSALEVPTVFACVDIISSNLARLPLNVYVRTGPDAFSLAGDQNLHWLLHTQPNPEMTSFVFRKTLQCHALLWANLYAEIARDGANRPVELWPRMPNQTRPVRPTKKIVIQSLSGAEYPVMPGELCYVTTDGEDATDDYLHPHERYIHRDDMLHIPGLSLDGRLGRGTIQLARQAIGLSLAAEKFGGKFFANGLRPTGVVTLPQALSEKAIKNFKESLREEHGGENMLRPMVLEEGMSWTNSDVKPNEAQFLETRQHQREEICAVFHVPPHMVGAAKDSSRASTEQMAIEFVQYTLGPWTVPWEQELERKLFPATGRTAGKYFPGFDTEELMWPDAESRGKYFQMLRQGGVANANDLRRKLKMNPIAGPAGEMYWMPVNMTDAANPVQNQPKGNDGGGKNAEPDADEPKDKNADPEASRYADAYRAKFSLAFKAADCVNLGERFREAFAPVLVAIAEGFAMNTSLLCGLNETLSIGPEIMESIEGYIGTMQSRKDKWPENLEAACEKELRCAVRAVRSYVQREIDRTKK